MLLSWGYISQKVCPLFLEANNIKCKIDFQPLRTFKSNKLCKPQDNNESKEKSSEPFPDLPPLIDLSDRNFTTYLVRMMAHPSTLLYSARNFTKECKMFYEMKREERRNNLILRDPRNHVDMLYTFEKEEDVERFLVTSDRTNNTGHSSASLVLTQEKTGLFYGHLDTEPIKTGNVKVAGFANMLGPRKRKGFRIRGCFDWTKYTHLVFKVRGDGRSYLVGLTVPKPYDEVQGLMYAHPLFTRGGPYWQIAKIPFSHFFFMNEGRITDFQNNPVALDQIGNLGITAAGFDGQFKLEIDYIGLEYDPDHIRLSPYEEYVGNY